MQWIYHIDSFYRTQSHILLYLSMWSGLIQQKLSSILLGSVTVLGFYTHRSYSTYIIGECYSHSTRGISCNNHTWYERTNPWLAFVSRLSHVECFKMTKKLNHSASRIKFYCYFGIIISKFLNKVYKNSNIINTSRYLNILSIVFVFEWSTVKSCLDAHIWPRWRTSGLIFFYVVMSDRSASGWALDIDSYCRMPAPARSPPLYWLGPAAPFPSTGWARRPLSAAGGTCTLCHTSAVN
jgi:hypothetical protein